MSKNLFNKDKEVIKKINSSNELEGKTEIVTSVHEGEQTGKSNVELLELYSKKNNIPIFKGILKNAYESDFLGYKDKCPECNTPTQRMMSNFAYATQEKPRLMAAPAGHFCPSCPTVIIDDDIMKLSIDSSRFAYGGVFTIETGYNEPQFFESFNGEKPLVILEEDMSTVGGIAQSVHIIEDGTFMYRSSRSRELPSKEHNIHKQKKKSSTRKKNKAAKNARKRNRK